MNILDWFNQHREHKMLPSDNPAKNLSGLVCCDCDSYTEYDSSSTLKVISDWRKAFYNSFGSSNEPRRTIIEDDFSMTQNYFNDD